MHTKYTRPMVLHLHLVFITSTYSLKYFFACLCLCVIPSLSIRIQVSVKHRNVPRGSVSSAYLPKRRIRSLDPLGPELIRHVVFSLCVSLYDNR
ncbi:hypothetical protein F4679DRAFT_276835 [Xylaria curta]|nr:hypothetical protein F4679DRAFT_276835 [Xylaria curta]